MTKRCKHLDWEAAGYPYIHQGGMKDIKVYSIYTVYCHSCDNFVNLLSGELINDKGLVRIGDKQWV